MSNQKKLQQPMLLREKMKLRLRERMKLQLRERMKLRLREKGARLSIWILSIKLLTLISPRQPSFR